MMKHETPWVLILGILLLAGGLVAHARHVLRVEEMAPPGRRADPSLSPAALTERSTIERVPPLPGGPAATRAILDTLVESCMRLKEGRLTARALADEMGTVQEPLLPPDPGEKPPAVFSFQPKNRYFKDGDVVRDSTRDGRPLEMPSSVFLFLRDPRHLSASDLKKALGKAYRPETASQVPVPRPMYFEWRKQPEPDKGRCTVSADLGFGKKFGVNEDVVVDLEIALNRGQ